MRKEEQNLGIALSVCIIFGWLILTGGCNTKIVKITKENVDLRIKSELPPGSDISQVKDFVKKNNWGGSEYLDFEDFGTIADMLTAEEKQKIKGYTTAGIRDAEKNFLGGRGILIHFYYDQEGKLVTYKLIDYGY